MSNLENSALKLIKEYSKTIQEKGYPVSAPARSNYNYQINISNREGRVALLIYFGKKGNKVVLQGNKELNLYREISDIVFGEQLFDLQSEKISEPDVYIGTDESGKGDYFGPLVVASVFVDKELKKKLLMLGVKDSKELSDAAITNIAKRIRAIKECVFNLIIINPEKYNLLYSKMQNVNRLLGWAHAKALENILEVKIAPEAISDKFGDEKFISTSLQSKGKNLKLHQVTKAERYTAVAAASILARDAVNKWFDRTSKEMKIQIPKGASAAVEATALKIKREMADNKLGKLVKLHFKTTKKIMNRQRRS